MFQINQHIKLISRWCELAAIPENITTGQGHDVRASQGSSDERGGLMQSSLSSCLLQWFAAARHAQCAWATRTVFVTRWPERFVRYAFHVYHVTRLRALAANPTQLVDCSCNRKHCLVVRLVLQRFGGDFGM